ncbi:MAG: hypothetical protein KA527_04695 [Cytophagaceae bacterium]|nr:hypothetical protein [Cytophagaceae bacterium]
MEAAKRVAKNTGILYIRMAITVFISLYSTRLILAALGVADFGLFNLVGGVISMLGFLNSSMAAATQRFMSFAQGAGDLERVKRIFNMSSLLHWGIAILVLFLLECAGYFFFHGILNIAPDRIEVAKLIYQFMVISTVFTVISVPYEAVITSHENMMVYAILGVFEAVLKLAIAFYITHTVFDHLVMYGVLMAALSVLLLIIKRIYCHRVYEECRLHTRKYYDKPLLKEMGGFAGWSLLGSSSGMLANYGQGIVLNIFFGTVINAAHSISSQISGQLGTFSVGLTKSMNPLLDKYEGAGNRVSMLKTIFTGTKISFFLLSILYVPFIIEMPFIMQFWLTNVPEYTVLFCRLLLIRNLIEQFYIPLSNAISSVGNIRRFQKANAVLNLLPIITSFLLFNFGFPAYTLYIIFIIFTTLQYFNVAHISKIFLGVSQMKYFNEVILKCASAFGVSLILGFLPLMFFSDSLIRLFLVSSAGMLSYLWLIRTITLTPEEKMIFKKLILSKFKILSLNDRI